jgi:hypothetical protein
VSAPWWHPEASPLRDIRELKRAAEEAYGRPPKILVAAPRYREAQDWARREGLGGDRWSFVAGPDELHGVHLGMVTVVNGQRLGRRGEWEALLRVLEATGTVVRRESA